jgi:predicted dehydrogenase
MGSGAGEILLGDDLVVTLKYADGSLATISYANGGHGNTEKERIEVLGRGSSAIIVDFRSVTLDSRTTGLDKQDKGHSTEIAAFSDRLRTTLASAELPFASSRTALLASRLLSVRAHDL